jgi:hypothetical protein
VEVVLVGEEGLEGLKLTDSGDGSDDLSELELVKDSGFTSSIQSNHEDSCMSVAYSTTNIVREGGVLSFFLLDP